MIYLLNQLLALCIYTCSTVLSHTCIFTAVGYLFLNLPTKMLCSFCRPFLPFSLNFSITTMCIPLERLDTPGSNSPPHPGKVQILHPGKALCVKLPTTWAWMTVKCQWVSQGGGGDVQALN